TFNDNPPELKKQAQVLTVTQQQQLYPFERFSSFHRLVRVTAYCCRFAKNCKIQRNQRIIGSLTTAETSNALKTLLKMLLKMSKRMFFRRFKGVKKAQENSTSQQIKEIITIFGF
ncbi:hypothetical protein QE152_g41310, partial [Popillia japonica]